MPEKPVFATLADRAITVDPWVVVVSKSGKDTIRWNGKGCRIKIDPDHPEHFYPELPSVYAPTIGGTFVESVPEGTYHYCISVLQDGDREVAAYNVDPDYKVDR